MTQEDSKKLCKYLTTIQYPKSNNGIQWLVDNETIEEYRQRTFITRKKITKVLRPLETGPLHNDPVHTILGGIQDALGVYNILTMLGGIQDALGVYNVPAILNGRSHSWSKMSSVNPYEEFQGTGWPRYLGSQDIAIEGGRVVVVLSDEGVEWLNSIADKVKSYIE